MSESGIRNISKEEADFNRAAQEAADEAGLSLDAAKEALLRLGDAVRAEAKSALDLDAIEARYNLAADVSRDEHADLLSRATTATLCANDVPALVAEVRRMRGLIGGAS